MTNTITKIAQLLDENSNTWHDIYEAPGADGNRITVIVPRDVRDANNLRKALLRGGADVPPLDYCRGALNAASEADAPVVRRAGRTGWRDNNRYFVGHRWVIGNAEAEVLPPDPRLIQVAGDLDVRGTLEGWQAIIGMAKHSTAMIVALCAVFAAPLLRLLNRPNFGLVLVGPSRCGKSSAQLIAASALGFGQEEHLPTLNTTPAGLSETGLVFNDHMLPINEIGTARGPKRDAHVVVRNSTYGLMSGRDAIRHSSWGGGSTASASFHVLPLLSSEHSPDEWAARGGEARDEGETARLIGVPILFDSHKSVFDRYSGVSEDQRPDWEWAMYERLRNGLPQHHGVAFKRYTEILSADMSTLVEDARDDAEAFCNAMAKPSQTPIERDIIAKFSVLYAGGCAAVDVEVLPLDRTRVGVALGKACRAALAALPDSEADLKADLLKLLKHLKSAGVIDADEASPRQKRNMESAEGYHEASGFGRLHTLRSETFGRLFPSELRTRKVLEWLDDQGFLRHARDRKPGVSKEWAQTHRVWPNGTRVRSFCLYFPGGLDVLDLDA